MSSYTDRIGKPHISPLHISGADKTDGFAAYAQIKAADPHIIDLAHSNASPDLEASINGIIEGRTGRHLLTYGTKNNTPKDLPALGHKALFEHMKGFENTNENNIAVAPQTSSWLNRELLKTLRILTTGALEAVGDVIPRRFVALYPEGNFRYNAYNERYSEVGSVVIPADPVTKLITPESLQQTIQECRDRGEYVLTVVLETPSNPWMVVYPPELLKNIAAITEKNNLYVLNDLYLEGTESLDEPQHAFAEFATRKDLVFTSHSMRRIFGLDDFGRVGFICAHDAEIAKEIQFGIRSSGVEFIKGDLEISAAMLKDHNPHDMSRRIQQATARSRTEQLVSESENLRVIVPSQSGPFITVGFKPEVEEKFAQLGITDGYKLAIYVAEKLNVLAIPLHDMGSNEMGFRMNVAYNWQNTVTALENLDSINALLEKGISYSSIEPQIRRTLAATTQKAI